jgi:hypothetical protein
MEAIINIEDRLTIIKALFEICIEAKVFPENIFISTLNQRWGKFTNFRAESLSLLINEPRNKKTIEIICNYSGVNTRSPDLIAPTKLIKI